MALQTEPVLKTLPEKLTEKFVELVEYNPWMAKVLERMLDMHIKKARDYASKDNPFTNFEDVAHTTGVPVDQVFRQFIAVKLARLKNLLKDGRNPQNESIEDSKLDLAVYSLLYLSYSEKISLE